jgi:hypothetical protein
MRSLRARCWFAASAQLTPPPYCCGGSDRIFDHLEVTSLRDLSTWLAGSARIQPREQYRERKTALPEKWRSPLPSNRATAFPRDREAFYAASRSSKKK